MLIKNSLIINNNFLESFHALLKVRMPAKQCLEISLAIEEISAQHQIVNRARRAIVDKYCSKDADGNPLQDGSGNLLFESPEIQKRCTDELNEIFDEEIDISLTKKIKIPADELMTPASIILLKDLIEIDETKEDC